MGDLNGRKKSSVQCTWRALKKESKLLDLKFLLVTTIRGVRFEVFTAVTMKNGVFCDVTPCLVRIDISVELSASNIRVTRIGELGTLAITSNQSNSSQHTSVISYG
jgi:hypothetical protein